ncbi:MAG: family 10 glycosylhydrolase [Clostridia bacterium]|nr:family 10 glycosylhydrolase [Clostridia bacterium]
MRIRPRNTLLPLLLAILILLTSCGVQAISLNLIPMQPTEENMSTTNIIDPSSEVRGVWIASVYNIDYPSAAGLDAAALQTEIDEIISTCLENGLNTIFFQVRPTCDALYKSELFPVSAFLSADGTLPFDPLEYIVSEAHKNNIFVHAWVNPLRVTMNSTDVNTLPENSPARQNPEWTVPYVDGKLYLNAGLPEVRNLVADGVREIVAGYDVDGVVFDDYFYPYPANGADGKPADFDDAAAYAAYGAGFEDKDAWRRDNINKLIAQVYDAVHTTDPDCLFGVSPFGIWQNDDGKNGGSATNGLEGYKALHCDALAWVEAGTVDYLSPQLYWQFTTTSAPYDVLVRWWNTVLENTGVDLYVSHAIYRYEDGNWAEPQGEMTEQLTFARSELSYKGSVFYGYDEIHKNTNGAADELKKLYANEIIYSEVVSNGRSVQVSTPANGATMSEASTYVIGMSDPSLPLYLDGKKIGRTKSGFFSLMVNLSYGENIFTFTQGEESYTYTLYYKTGGGDTGSSQEKVPVVGSVQISSFTPAHDVLTDAGTLDVSCVAPYGSKVTATLDGTTISLTMSEKPSRTWDENGYVAVTYSGTFQLPRASAGQLYNAGNVVYSVSHTDGSASVTGAKIRTKGTGAKLAVKIKQRYAELKFTETSSYYNDYTVQSPGMTDYVKAQKNGFYELRMGGFIAEEWVEEIYSAELADKAAITKAVVSDRGDHTELRLTTGGSNLPYYGRVENGKFLVTLYNADAANSVTAGVKDNPLFSASNITRTPEQNRVRYELTLKDEVNFYGFDLYYENGDIVITFRNPVALDLTKDKPLEGIHIILDAGHGGTDRGAAGAQTAENEVLHEEDLNLLITLETEKLLKELGADVELTRREDVTLDLYARMDILKEKEPDLCISIHQNSMGYTSDITRIRGVLPLYWANSGRLLADTVGAGVAASTGRYLRDTYQQMLAMCRNPKFPQTLIEVGFITCVEEYEQMVSGQGITLAAEGIRDGVLEYFRRQAAYAN